MCTKFLIILKFYTVEENSDLPLTLFLLWGGVSRSEIKKLADAGDCKAALVLGLTYEFRFVCEKAECELAIRPPFEYSRPFSNRKAVKYYTIAAEHNSVEAFAALARMHSYQVGHDQERAVKDYLMKSKDPFKSCGTLLYSMCYNEELYHMKEQLEEEDADEPLIHIPGITGLMLFRLNYVTTIKYLIQALRIPKLFRAHCHFKKSKSVSVIVCSPNKVYKIYLDPPRSVENEIFIQKADDLEDEDRTVAKIDHDYDGC